jgi:phosphohistidine phosphatase
VDLYLVRHAVAFEEDPARWPDDSRRPLTPRGERDFRPAARGIGRLVPSVEVVLSSPFPRAWSTAEILGQEAGWPEPVAAPGLEKDRTPADAIKAIEEHAARSSMAVVGHEPNLTELASTLLGTDRVSIELEKGGAMALDGGPAILPGSAVLRWLVTPEVLRSLEG